MHLVPPRDAPYPVPKKTGRPESACWGAKLYLARIYCYFAALFCLAHRAFCASEISLRAAADIVRRFFGAEVVAGLLILPGGLPRRFAGADAPLLLTPSKANIAASSLLRSFLSC